MSLLVAALSTHLLEGMPTLRPSILRDLVNKVGEGEGEEDLRSSLSAYDADSAEAAARRLDHLMEYERMILRLGESGISPVCPFDPSYPNRWRERLGDRSPAMIFSSGNLAILNGESVGVVGSRNIDEEGREFASEVAAEIAKMGYALVSGGARGVDSVAMNSAHSDGGEVLGILADSLLRAVADRDVAERLEGGRLCLCTPYAPSAGFSAGNAMGRNKLIYAHAQATVVVSSDLETGGTWAGAVEALRLNLGGLLVRSGESAPPGNRALIGKGGVSVKSPADLASAVRSSRMAQESLFQGES